MWLETVLASVTPPNAANVERCSCGGAGCGARPKPSKTTGSGPSVSNRSSINHVSSQPMLHTNGWMDRDNHNTTTVLCTNH